VGEYKNNKKDGYGEFSWPTNGSYKGHWKEGKKHGKGVEINAEG